MKFTYHNFENLPYAVISIHCGSLDLNGYCPMLHRDYDKWHRACALRSNLDCLGVLSFI